MDPRPPEEPVQLGLGDPLAGLSAWVAEGRVDEAAAARARQRWLERQAEEGATFTGTLVDLAERGGPVVIRTLAGHGARGRIVAIGADFVIVRGERPGEVIVPHQSIAAVRSAPGARADRDAPVHTLLMVLGETLVELAADRPLVVVAAAGEEVRGTLRAAGRDVLTVEMQGRERERIHVPLSALDHLVVLAAG